MRDTNGNQVSARASARTAKTAKRKLEARRRARIEVRSFYDLKAVIIFYPEFRCERIRRDEAAVAVCGDCAAIQAVGPRG